LAATLKLIFQDTLPRKLRRSLERDAREKNITMNDVAGRILSDLYGTKWIDTGARFKQVVEPFRLRVPDDLWLKIRLDSVSRDGTIRGVVLDALMQHYQHGSVDPRRRPRASVH
jgi:hypothetical protein